MSIVTRTINYTQWDNYTSTQEITIQSPNGFISLFVVSGTVTINARNKADTGWLRINIDIAANETYIVENLVPNKYQIVGTDFNMSWGD